MNWITDPIVRNSDMIIPICLVTLVVLAVIGLLLYWRRSGLMSLAIVPAQSPQINETALVNASTAATSKVLEQLIPRIVGTIEIAGIVEFINELEREDGDALKKLKQLPEIHQIAAMAYTAEQMRVGLASSIELLNSVIKSHGVEAAEPVQKRVDYYQEKLEKLASYSKPSATLIKLP